MILVIDNFDSFTYNLVQALGELNAKPVVFRNNEITVKKAALLNPTHLVVSPGPCTPKEAGNSNALIKYFAGKIPVLGVCLGHQCIASVFGGKIVKAEREVHGKTSLITHDNKTIFSGLKNPFQATRYHSLIVEKKSLPSCFEISAESLAKQGQSNQRVDSTSCQRRIAAESKGVIMAIRHKEFSVEGIQFHPESFLTIEGKKLLKNFLTK